MAVKAVCSITQVLQDADDITKFVAVVSYAAFQGTLPTFGSHDIHGLVPSGSGSTITTQIEEAMQVFLSNNSGGGGVSFGPSDFVLLLPR